MRKYFNCSGLSRNRVDLHVGFSCCVFTGILRSQLPHDLTYACGLARLNYDLCRTRSSNSRFTRTPFQCRQPEIFLTSVELLRTKHKYGESYYWLLYYTYLSPQQLANTQEIIEKLEPHIRDISYRTYFRKRQMAIDALSSVLWGYSSKESLALLEKFVPEANT